MLLKNIKTKILILQKNTLFYVKKFTFVNYLQLTWLIFIVICSLSTLTKDFPLFINENR